MLHRSQRRFKRLTKISLLMGLGLINAACGSGGDNTPAPPPTFQLSGTMSMTSTTAIDSDVNDPAAPVSVNDSFASAQFIPNPAIVGGYLNRPGQGEAGRSFSGGDASDRYLVFLSAGQFVSMTGAAASADLDLYLFPATCTDSTCNATCVSNTTTGSVAQSVQLDSRESIAITTSGDYYIVACSFPDPSNEASNYVLTISQFGVSGSAQPNFNADFVPGQLVLGLPQTQSRFNAQSISASLAQDKVRILRSDGRRALVEFDVNTDVLQKAAASFKTGDAHQRKLAMVATFDEKTRARWHTLNQMRILSKKKSYDYVEPNYIYQPSLLPNDTHYDKQWHYPLINLPQAWDISTGDQNVIVAVIDTGVLLSHPDLLGKLVAGYDFISDDVNANDGDGIDSNPDDPGDGGDDEPSSFHGTHVAGTIAANTNNNDGVAGVSWQSRIMPLRALGLTGGTTYDLAQAIRYAARLANDSSTLPAQAADIINMSLGGGGFSQLLHDAIQDARGQGILVVAASGNENTSVPSYPAANDGVISVGAIGPAKQRAPYSNFGPTLDVVAPGGNAAKDLDGDGFPDGVLSTRASDDDGSIVFNYGFLEGTSMATPHVAGVLALMKAVNPTLTPGEVDTWLASGLLTEDLGTSGRDDDFGHGLIDAHKALVEVSAGAPLPALLTVAPNPLHFGTVLTGIDVTASNGGGSVLDGVTVSESASWLSIAATDIDAATGLGTYRFNVDRSGLAAGVHSTTALFSSSANSASVEVTAQVAPQNIPPDAGYHYILLVNSLTDEVAVQTEASAANGAYSFNFTGVSEGDYFIIAGTDSNNDGLICDDGEACGLYPTLDLPVTLHIDADRSDLDFVTGFATNFSASDTSNARPATRRYAVDKTKRGVAR